MGRKDPKGRGEKGRSRRRAEPPGAGPVRTCLGCRERKRQHELLRFVRAEGGAIVVGRAAPGRGFYVCPRLECTAKLERGLYRRLPAEERTRAREVVAQWIAKRSAGGGS
ncbi:MAG: DUF448 domain-containing protein [Candidatus Latescibacterota bacterium]|nr:MAG: DUF448 domain-containing protein [Candidatus Latescibacterota bacterium]